MSVVIKGVEPGSPAAKKGVLPGDTLESINNSPIRDVLDYRFYMTDTRLALALRRGDAPFTVTVRKGEYDDLGLEFETYLMDRQHTCRVRVQGAGMTDFFHTENSPQFRHHVMGSEPFFFIYV